MAPGLAPSRSSPVVCRGGHKAARFRGLRPGMSMNISGVRPSRRTISRVAPAISADLLARPGGQQVDGGVHETMRPPVRVEGRRLVGDADIVDEPRMTSPSQMRSMKALASMECMADSWRYGSGAPVCISSRLPRQSLSPGRRTTRREVGFRVLASFRQAAASSMQRLHG